MQLNTWMRSAGQLTMTRNQECADGYVDLPREFTRECPFVKKWDAVMNPAPRSSRRVQAHWSHSLIHGILTWRLFRRKRRIQEAMCSLPTAEPTPLKKSKMPLFSSAWHCQQVTP